MPDRRFTLPAASETVFPGSDIDNIRLYHDDIVLMTDERGIHVTIPETVDCDTLAEAVFHLTDVHGFAEVV